VEACEGGFEQTGMIQSSFDGLVFGCWPGVFPCDRCNSCLSSAKAMHIYPRLRYFASACVVLTSHHLIVPYYIMAYQPPRAKLATLSVDVPHRNLGIRICTADGAAIRQSIALADVQVFESNCGVSTPRSRRNDI
jgi:hypothetical protein